MDLITAGTALASFVAGKGAKAQLQTFDDIWYLVFNPITQMADKKRIENEYNVNHYRSILGNMLIDIPEENLQEPPLSIVGPALEASKYYIEEEVLREMFAKVIAGSMDNRKSDMVHHSFVEILKQLSPRDAKNISLFKAIDNYPIARYRANRVSGESFAILDPIIFSSSEDGTINKRDFSSITNLIRLGLLNSNFTTYIYSSTYYTLYEKNALFEYYKNNIDPKKDTLVSEKGVLSITPLGREFIKICL